MMVGIVGSECELVSPAPGNGLVGVEAKVDEEVDRGVFMVSSSNDTKVKREVEILMGD